jgi:hypothetical protein
MEYFSQLDGRFVELKYKFTPQAGAFHFAAVAGFV